MIFNLFQLVLVFVIFFLTKYLSWKITSEWCLPLWLRYRPWECYKCLSFWSLMALFAVCGLVIHLWVTMAVGGVLTLLDTIAYSIEIKNKTIKIEDI